MKNKWNESTKKKIDDVFSKTINDTHTNGSIFNDDDNEIQKNTLETHKNTWIKTEIHQLPACDDDVDDGNVHKH